MTIIFIAIPSPLPEESSGRKEKKKKYYRFTDIPSVLPSKGNSTEKKVGKLIKGVSKLLMCCGLPHSLFSCFLQRENCHISHKVARLMFSYQFKGHGLTPTIKTSAEHLSK